MSFLMSYTGNIAPIVSSFRAIVTFVRRELRCFFAFAGFCRSPGVLCFLDFLFRGIFLIVDTLGSKEFILAL